jgi:SAM-dependent methyltransferase
MCHLFFRRPYLSSSELDEQYRKLPSNLWPMKERSDFTLALDVICRSFSSGPVLDIGCSCGDFLGILPDNYQKYGVEIAEESRKILQKQGVILIGSSIDQMEIHHPTFRAITLFDVIEHLPYPFLSLQGLSNLLLPDGILILSTGNTATLPWRLTRQDYWYYLTEHVSFFNPHWFRWAATQLGLKLVMVKKFSHFNGSLFERWHQFAHCLAFWIFSHTRQYPSLHKIIMTIYPFNRVKKWHSAPNTNHWRDHIIVVLQSSQ